jgi:hypothetical protein
MNTKPFDLTKCPPATPLSGVLAQTRDGRHVRIVCTDAPGQYPLIGIINSGSPTTYTNDGRQVSGETNGADLVNIPTKRRVFIALFRHTFVGHFFPVLDDTYDKALRSGGGHELLEVIEREYDAP